jgi:hypothetical protein
LGVGDSAGMMPSTRYVAVKVPISENKALKMWPANRMDGDWETRCGDADMTIVAPKDCP